MKFQSSALLLLAASIEAFTPLSNGPSSNVALNAAKGLTVDLPSIESQVSRCFELDYLVEYCYPCCRRISFMHKLMQSVLFYVFHVLSGITRDGMNIEFPSRRCRLHTNLEPLTPISHVNLEDRNMSTPMSELSVKPLPPLRKSTASRSTRCTRTW